MNTAQMAQPVTSFRTITPSTPATTDTMTTKQVDPVHVHENTSWNAPPAHRAHVHKSTIQVCKPGELLVLMKQDILSQYSSCFEGIGCFPGDPYKFHLKPEHKPA